jgi:DNA-directed RNA polymerase specialized sigma24 family protein
MDDPQATRESLLVRLGDGRDKQAWFDFVDLYSPIIYGFARRQGLQDADAADLVQEVLRSVARSLSCYDHRKGRFRSWLMAVVRHRLSEFRAGQGRQVAGSGDTQVLQQLEQVSAVDGSSRSGSTSIGKACFGWPPAGSVTSFNPRRGRRSG